MNDSSTPNQEPPGPDDRPAAAHHGPSWKAVLLTSIAVAAALLVGARYAEALRAGYERVSAAVWPDQAADGTASEQAAAQYYTCGMHPWVVLPEPGGCPICGMDLVPLDPDKFTGQITIDPVVMQNMGVRVEEVTTGPLKRTIRTVGTIDYDETRVRDVNIKVSGWIEKLHVDYRGQRVEKGQPLFELYSPQLYQAQEEYLLAWRNRKRSGSGGGEGGQTPLLRSARTRLEYFDITDEQIQRLRDRGQPAKTMTIRSPHGGTVIDKHATEGMKVDPGMRVYRIADLSEVWVMVTLYEQQLPYVSEGQQATMRLSYIPGQTFQGKVIYVYPFLDGKTRQVKVRLEFPNPEGLLKPGMFATVELRSELAERATLVPRSAVIDTGQRQVAFVSRGGGKFEPRELTLGAETNGDKVRVLDGLKPGEQVVTSGQFLLDSEARMREALAKMIEGESPAERTSAGPPAERSELEALPDKAAESLVRLLEAYFAAGESLAADRLRGLDKQGRRITASVKDLTSVDIPDHPHFWHEHNETSVIREKASRLAQADSAKDARLLYAELSVALDKLLGATGVPATFSRAVERLHCPMYLEGQGGSVWLQPTGEVRNPFMGQRMPGCFDERRAMPVTGGGPNGATDRSGGASGEEGDRR